MPTPEGQISTSAVWTQPEELDTAIVEADAEEAVTEYEAEDDLPELS